MFVVIMSWFPTWSWDSLSNSAEKDLLQSGTFTGGSAISP